MQTRNRHYKADVVIIGGGFSGLVTAFELLDSKKRILLLDRDLEGKLGGLAKESFGGIMAVDTPLQRRSGIRDSTEIAWADWKRIAGFSSESDWPALWAKAYVEESRTAIFDKLRDLGIRFLPVVNWPERGLFQPANSLPRWHIAWGTGHRIIERLLAAIHHHPNRKNLTFRFGHKVEEIVMTDGRATGCSGRLEMADGDFLAEAGVVVVAAGGICGGDLSRVKANWPEELGEIPERLLNGAHIFADGTLHDAVEEAGGRLTHLSRQWHYAAGIPYPKSHRLNHGLSLVPPKSALWLDATGRRMGPVPLMGYQDTKHLVTRIANEPAPHTWIVMNRKIALKELAVSGCDYMESFRHRKFAKMLAELLLGNRELFERLAADSKDVLTAPTLSGLSSKMTALDPDHPVSMEKMATAIREYDCQIDRGEAFFTDDQLRRIAICRKYRGDRLRTCKFQKLLDPKAAPLVAIRTFLLTRKSLGGIRTDLKSRVLDHHDLPIEGLLAVGEAAGFGGGNIHGKASLEGTFLGSCMLTGQKAAAFIRNHF